MPRPTVSSASNPVVRRLRQLRSDRRLRHREGAFVVEGIQPVWRAVESGADVELLVVSPELLHGSPAERLVADQQSRGTPVVRLTPELFTRLSDREGPAGLAAIVHRRSGALADLHVTRDSFCVAVHEVASPGNLGTIIRSAEAFGAAGVVLLGDSTDPFAPQAVKSSMGSLFALPVVHEASLNRFFDWAEQHGITTVATSAHATRPIHQATWQPPLALLLGSERTGLPKHALARGQVQVAIPMRGGASSLNLAVAAGVFMYEVRRRLG